jgi:hypothetical protein
MIVSNFEKNEKGIKIVRKHDRNWIAKGGVGFLVAALKAEKACWRGPALSR